MDVSNWDPARCRFGFNYLEALAFAKLDPQPFLIVRHGTEAQIQDFEQRLSSLPSKYLLIMLNEANIEVAHQVGRVIGADSALPSWFLHLQTVFCLSQDSNSKYCSAGCSLYSCK